MSFLVCGALLLGTLSRSGIGEPYELEHAELSRRLAVHVFGAESLRLDGVANHMPTLTDLGAGELGFTSMAWGFAQFGLHDWAGRLPLALWGLLTALTIFALIARLASARAGLISALVLCTMPLFFVQARTMLGDAATIAAFTFCFAGLLGSWLDTSQRARGVWLAIGVVGALLGYLSRGLLIGVASPSLAVGVSFASWRAAGAGQTKRVAPDLLAWLGAGGGLVLGAAAAVTGVWCLSAAGHGHPLVERSLAVTILSSAPPEATFDMTLRDMGHALFPWSALLPFAAGRLLRMPPALATEAREREGALRLSLLLGAAVSYAINGFVAPYSGALPYTAVALLAAVCALALTDLSRGLSGSGMVAFGSALTALLLARDLATLPARLFSAFGVASFHYPADVALPQEWLLWLVTGVFAASMALAWVDDDGVIEGCLLQTGRREAGALGRWVRARIQGYEEAATALNSAWQGNLSFGFLLVEAALVGLAATLWIGRRVDWRNIREMPHTLAVIGFNGWWVMPLALIGAPLVYDVARLSFAWCVSRSRLRRGSVAALMGVVAGALASLFLYPSVMAQLSPRQALAHFAERHQRGESLGLLGVNDKVARYYADGERVEPLLTVPAAAEWLAADTPDKHRRWMVVAAADFAGLNASYRATRGANLAVVDARPGFPLLAVSQLNDEVDKNPLSDFVLNGTPAHIQHPLDAVLDNKLQALGWDVVDERGELVRFVVPGRTFVIRSYYRVLGKVRRDYQAFLHVDGYGRRHNGDHDMLHGKYPMSLWHLGDVLVDHYEVVLEPNFLPGQYSLFYGLFVGKKRMPVTSGRHRDNRIVAGTLQVR